MRKRNLTTWLAMTIVAMRANGASGAPIYDNQAHFDTDSGLIGVDNHASGCISDRIDDFDGPLQDCNHAIKGFGRTRTTNIKIGTIIWKWGDDKGKIHKFRIPNSFYVPEGKYDY